MSQNTQPDKGSMSDLQKQAVLVCVICALAALLTIGITLTLLGRGKQPDTPASESSSTDSTAASGQDLSGHYQIDTASDALLTQTDDAGTDYLNDTLFLGDSNTVRLYSNGLVSLQQFCAKEGIGTQAALNDQIVTFKGTSQHYTIAEAVALMKPRRVVLTFGTNDNGMDVDTFISNYTALVQAIQASYPYTDIIVNTIPPIPENHSTYPHMDQAKIDDFNMALLKMCEQLDVKFLNSAETLKGENGYGNADYYTSGDIHLKTGGLKAVLTYLRTHAYLTEDRRPDTSNIPTRTLEYSSNPSSAVPAPSSSESSSESDSESASSSEPAEVLYEARYKVDKNGGGTLSGGGESGKTSLSIGVTDAAQAVKVTAVPAEGYVFVKWSDGKTEKTRTDTGFEQNLEVTAVFSSLTVKISGEGSSTPGGVYTFRASMNGKYASAENLHWYANGTEVTEAAGRTNIRVSIDPAAANTTYKIYAVVTYNDCSVTSNTLTITVTGGASSESSSVSSSSSSSSSVSSSSASSGSSGSSSSSSGASSSGAFSGSTSQSSASSSGSSSSSSSGTSSSSSSSASASSASSSSSSAASASSSENTSKAPSESEAKSTASSTASSSENAQPASSSEHTASSSSHEAASASSEQPAASASESTAE